MAPTDRKCGVHDERAHCAHEWPKNDLDPESEISATSMRVSDRKNPDRECIPRYRPSEVSTKSGLKSSGADDCQDERETEQAATHEWDCEIQKQPHPPRSTDAYWKLFVKEECCRS